jgi:hypothetical protein
LNTKLGYPWISRYPVIQGYPNRKLTN